MRAGRDLISHLARFARALREEGVPVRLSDEVDAATALDLVDVLDRAEVRSALHATFRVRRSDWALFETLFDRWWVEEREGGRSPEQRTPRLARPRPLSARPAIRWQRLSAMHPETETPQGDTPGYSPQPILRRKAFDECSDAELAEMERLLSRMMLQLATRRSRRLIPTRGRGLVDLRRTLRRSVPTGGELMHLARRARAIEIPSLVLLCDTSGSMDTYARFLLTFVLSLRKTARRAEVFVFNTDLTRITALLSPGKIAPTLDRLATQVPDWSGGTRIGDSLQKFVDQHLDALVDKQTTVIILSDGLDRGEPSGVVRAMRAIKGRARRVIWLNPLLGDPRYEPTARGMAAALPYIDLFRPAHNIDSLEGLLPHLAA